jgi:hypothetical protein
MKRLLAVAASVAVLALAAASGALAGEVKGPPGVPCPDKSTCVQKTDYTAGTFHANSFCVFSGLNDMDPNDPNGQTTKITQTPADGPHGAPGLGFEVAPGVTISCRGGSNLERGVGG